MGEAMCLNVSIGACVNAQMCIKVCARARVWRVQDAPQSYGKVYPVPYTAVTPLWHQLQPAGSHNHYLHTNKTNDINLKYAL